MNMSLSFIATTDAPGTAQQWAIYNRKVAAASGDAEALASLRAAAERAIGALPALTSAKRYTVRRARAALLRCVAAIDAFHPWFGGSLADVRASTDTAFHRTLLARREHNVRAMDTLRRA